MKIAFWHNLSSGGGKRAAHDFVRGLVGRGHEITAWCPSTADTSYMPLNLLVKEEVRTIPTGAIPGPLEYLMRVARADSQQLPAIRGMMAHAQAFAAEVESRGFDVVFASPCRSFLAPFVARCLKTTPSVLYLHEPNRFLYEASTALPWIAEDEPDYPWWHPATLRHWLGSAARVHSLRVQAREELKNAKAFDRILVNSYFSRESILRAYGIDPYVSYLGIDATTFALTDRAREPLVLSVGSLTPAKNPEFVIRAVAASETRPRLVWVANFAYPEVLKNCQRLATDLGIDLDVRVRVAEEELADYYGRASIFLYAPRLEPFGFAPLEAGARGTPVIAVGEGGVRETVVDGITGMIVGSEPALMGRAIDYLIRHPERAREMGRAGAADVRKRWNLDAAIDQVERHLTEVVRARH